MTNVKFRSWIPSIQTFTYFEDGVYSCPKVDLYKVPFDWDNAEQYIELKDINKKEIYVGDILVDIDGYIRIVRGEFGGAFAEHAPELNKFIQGVGEPTGDPHTASWIMQSCSVVYNIHESPELLSTY